MENEITNITAILGIAFVLLAIVGLLIITYACNEDDIKSLIVGFIFAIIGTASSLVCFIVGSYSDNGISVAVTTEEKQNEAGTSTATCDFYCVSCGNGLTSNMSFCPKCGSEIKSTS